MPEIEHPKRFVSGGSFEDGIMFANKEHMAAVIKKDEILEPVLMKRPPIPHFGIIPIISGLKRLSFMTRSMNNAQKEIKFLRDGEYTETVSIWGLISAVAIQMILLPHIFLHVFFWIIGYQVSIQVFNAFCGLTCTFLFFLIILLLKVVKPETAKYHGAEHMGAQAYEGGLPLTIENIRKFSPYHPRCGTALVTLFAFLIPMSFYLLPIGGGITGILIKIVLFFIVLAFSLDLFIVLNMFAPRLLFFGTWMQRLTVSYPDDEHIDVAISALNLLDSKRWR